VDPEVPSLLRGDPGRLRQILVNMTGNAIKFTHEGEVSIRAVLEKETSSHAVVLFRVTDTGIGIPAHRLKDLFSPFTQVDGSTTRKYGGTGLGLSISKQLAEMMGGRIGVESYEKEGSTFWFTVRFEKQSGEVQVSFKATDRVDNVRMLVVDDHETNRLLVRQLVESWGGSCDEASGGAEAIEKLLWASKEQSPYRAALIDMQMPEMDGEELGGRIKADPRIDDTILVMLTSLGRRGDRKRLEASGFNAYLTKPIRQHHLHDALCLALSLKNHEAKIGGGEGLITRHTLSEAKKQGMRILLAEDNPTNQQVALAVLNKLGYQADAVIHGREVLEAMRKVSYDLVLMDCQMPEMDGYETTGMIRKGKAGENNIHIPVIAMTAHAMKGDREKCLAAGMNDYLAKPIDPQAVADALNHWLGKAKEPIQAVSRGRVVNPSRKKTSGNMEVKIPAIFEYDDLSRRLMGDELLIVTVLNAFLEDMPMQITAIQESVERGLAEKVCAQAHKIKGAAGSIGSPVFQETAHIMETAGIAGDTETFRKQMPVLEKQFDLLKQAIMSCLPDSRI